MPTQLVSHQGLTEDPTLGQRNAQTLKHEEVKQASSQDEDMLYGDEEESDAPESDCKPK